MQQNMYGMNISKLISEQLSLCDNIIEYSIRDEEGAKQCYDPVQSIPQSTHYSFETKHVIDINNSFDSD